MKTNNAKLGVALWGLGVHAKKNILPAIEKSQLVELIGIHTRNYSNSVDATSEYGGVAWKTTDEMLGSQDVDIIYLATPTGMHYDQGEKVLNANKHLVCEKSLTCNYTDSVSLIQKAEQKSLVLCEAFMYLYHPQFLKVKKLVDDQELGEILNISSYFGIPKLKDPGFRISKKLGGSAFLDVGSYTISAINALIDIKPVKVNAEFDYQGTEIDMAGMAHMYYGKSLNAYSNWGYNRSYRAEIMIWGENRSVFADKIFSKNDTYQSSLALRDMYGNIENISISPANSFVEMIKVFHSAISNDVERKKLYIQTLHQAETMSMVYESAVNN